MKIGIIVHSKTGNTLSVANELRDRFLVCGHTVSVERVSASNDEETKIGSVALTSVPKIDAFDMLIFGAPVRGCMLSPVMQAYLHQITSLKGKHVSGFVTQFFPTPSMGGNQAIARMTELCSAKGAEVTQTGIVNWMFPFKRKKLIAEAANRIAGIRD